MVKIVIRDDDMNFFTKVEDVESVYRRIEGFPISYAIIPNVIDVSTYGRCPDTKGNTKPRWIGDNSELSTWLKEKLFNKSIDVLMHGITHEYHFVNGQRLAEMEWRKGEQLVEDITDCKKKLEQLLDYNITTFVAPSNKISKFGIQCVTQSGLNFSGIVPLNFERQITAKNINSYIKRTTVRLFKKIPYPGVLSYSDHLEFNACVMQGYDYLVKIFRYCNERNLPMAINVHYWDMRDNPNKYRCFFDFIKYALDNSAIPSTMSDVINNYQSSNI